MNRKYEGYFRMENDYVLLINPFLRKFKTLFTLYTRIESRLITVVLNSQKLDREMKFFRGDKQNLSVPLENCINTLTQKESSKRV